MSGGLATCGNCGRTFYGPTGSLRTRSACAAELARIAEAQR